MLVTLIKQIAIDKVVYSIVDSLPQGLLEGRPGSSLLLTPHQVQQLQQLQAQQEQAGAALTFTLQQHHTGGAGCLGPQLVLAPPQGFTYQAAATAATQCSSANDAGQAPIIQHIGHTSILQSSIQHHVRQSSIHQQVIQQVGQTSIQQVQQLQVGGPTAGGAGGANAIRSVDASKCVSASPGSPFSSQSLTSSPQQQRVITPQPHIHQVMGGAGHQVLQIFHHQQATRNTVTNNATIPVNHATVKPKQPPQILPKPPANASTVSSPSSTSSSPSLASPISSNKSIGTSVASAPPTHITTGSQVSVIPQQQQVQAQHAQQQQQASALVFNQMIPSGPVLVQQQTSSGVQLILRSPPPQPPQPPPPPPPQPKSGGVVILQGRQQAQQVVRLLQGLQIQQIQTSSGPTLIAVPAHAHHTTTVPAPAVTPTPTQTPTPTPTPPPPPPQSPSLLHKKITLKKKKKKEEEPRLDLANLIKLSGIEEEDVGPMPTVTPVALPSAAVPVIQQHHQHVIAQQHPVPQPQQQQHGATTAQQFVQITSPRSVASTPPTNVNVNVNKHQSHLVAQLQAPTQCVGSGGLRLSVAEDGRMVVHQNTPQVTPSIAATAQTQLAQLLAEHGGQLLQTAVLSWSGHDSLLMKAGGNVATGLALSGPSVVINAAGMRRPTHAPTSVVVANPLLESAQQNGVRILTDINGLTQPQQQHQQTHQPQPGRLHIVPNNSAAAVTLTDQHRLLTDQHRLQIVNSLTEQQNRVQIVSGVPSSSATAAMSVTEQQNKVHIVSGVPNSSSLSLTEQQNRVQILSGIQNANAMSLAAAEQQNSVQIVSGVQNSNTVSVTEQQNRVQIVSDVPDTSCLSLTEQKNRIQILSGVGVGVGVGVQTSNAMSLTEHQNRLHIVSGVTTPNCTVSEHQNRVHIVSGLETPSSDSQTISRSNSDSNMEHNRVQIVSGLPNPNSLSLTEQQNRVQIVSGVPNCGGMSLVSGMQNSSSMLTEHQNRVQIVSGVPSCGIALTEQQNRVQIVSGVQTSTGGIALTEQQNRVQIVTSVPSTNTISNVTFSDRHRVHMALKNASTPDHNRVHQGQQQNRIQIVSAIQNPSALSRTENQRVQIVSGIPNPMCSIATMSRESAQNRVQLMAEMPGGGTVPVNEVPSRVQIVTGVPSALDNKVSVATGTQTLPQINEQRVQILTSLPSSEHNHISVVTSTGMCQPGLANLSDQKLHIVSTGGIPTNSTGVCFNDRVHIVTTMANCEQNRGATLFNNDLGDSQLQQRLSVHPSCIGTGDQSRTTQYSSSKIMNQSKNVIHNQYSVQPTISHPGQSVINSMPSPQSPRSTSSGTSRSPIMFPPHSPVPINVVTSQTQQAHPKQPFANRPNLTVVPSQTILPTALGSSYQSHQPHSNMTSSNSNNLVITTNSSPAPQTHCVATDTSSLSQNLLPQLNSGYHISTSQVINKPVTTIASTNHLVDSIVQTTQSHPTVITSSSNCQSLPVITKPIPTTIINRPQPHIQQTQQTQNQHQQTLIRQSLNSNNHNNNSNSSNISNNSNNNNSGSSSSSSNSNSYQNTFLESIVQSHPSLVINKSLTPPVPKPALKPKKLPKKSAVVKPMMIEDRNQSHVIPSAVCPSPISVGSNEKEAAGAEPPSLVPISSPNDTSSVVQPMSNVVSSTGNTNSSVQRVQTIQLTPQKQQHLKAVQNQITILTSRKNRTASDQATLQRLFVEQQKILLSGKLVTTIPGQHAQGFSLQVSTPMRLMSPPGNNASNRHTQHHLPHQHQNQNHSPQSQPSHHHHQQHQHQHQHHQPHLTPTTTTPPTTINKATSPIHVQVGTQTSSCDSSPSPPPICTPTQTNTPSPAASAAAAAAVAAAAAAINHSKRATMIEQQLHADRQGACGPDTDTPFTSISDTCKRLVRYHSFDDPVLSQRDLEKADEFFEATARHLLDKNTQMLNKYNYLLLMESMRQVQTSELIMLGRMFVADETARLDQLRQEAVAAVNNTNAANSAISSASNSTQPQHESPNSVPTASPSQITAATSSLAAAAAKISTTVVASNAGCKVTSAIGGVGGAVKRERDKDKEDCCSVELGETVSKKHCPDDEEINAQVQNAIDSILNLQKSDPALDEAVRSILTS